MACKEKLELLAQLKELSKERSQVQMDELGATLTGKSNGDIPLRAENAEEMRKILLNRLYRHIAEHGC